MACVLSLESGDSDAMSGRGAAHGAEIPDRGCSQLHPRGVFSRVRTLHRRPRGAAMRTAIRRSTGATAVLASGLQTALPALAGVFVVPLLVLLLPFVPAAAKPVRALAGLERERAGRHLGYRLPEAAHAEAGGRWRAVRDPATWRDLLWMVVHGLAGTFLGMIGIALWPAIAISALTPAYWWLFPPDSFTGMLIRIGTWPEALTLPLLQAATYAAAVYWLVPLVARGQLRLARSLLGPSDAE